MTVFAMLGGGEVGMLMLTTLKAVPRGSSEEGKNIRDGAA